MQIRWSESSDSDGDDGEVGDCDIVEDDDDDGEVAEVQDEDMSSMGASSSGRPRASIGDFKFSFAANVNSGA